MPFDHIAELSAWLREAGIDEFELIGPSMRLRLDIGSDQSGIAEIEHAVEQPAEIIVAPTFGVFLHRHPMSNAPLAAEGSPVRAGQVVGLLRIGPLLVPVTSPKEGVITVILAAHEATVGYGSELIAFQPHES
jgi:acetyl-CoA carboxylase biotin carboxyl carrier protein